MSDLNIATAALGMQQAMLGNDATMMMLKQVIQQEQAVLQIVQAATQSTVPAASQPHLGQNVNMVA